jgi:hypothetical protein
MQASGRWQPLTDDPSVFVPGDITALRSVPVARGFAYMIDEFGGPDVPLWPKETSQNNLLVAALLPSLAIYRAQPIFVPAPVVRQAIGARTSPPSHLLDDLRLPFPVVWVVFEREFELPDEIVPGGTLTGSADPDHLWTHPLVVALMSRGGSMSGVVIFAGQGGRGIANEVVWCVSAAPDPGAPPMMAKDRQRGVIHGRLSAAALRPVAENLAMMIAASESYGTPPDLPGIGKPGTDRWYRSLTRHKAKAALHRGAGTGVRVVRFLPHTPRRVPPPDAAGMQSPETGPEIQHSHRGPVRPHLRSGHWRGVRVATRDADGAIVGNVHGQHGVDWHYEPRFVADVFIHPELADQADPQVWKLQVRPTPAPSS